MRLINADALVEQMEADAEYMEDPIAKMFTYAAISDVKHAPTVEDAVSREDVMRALKEEYNRRHAKGEHGLKLAWIEKAINSAGKGE